MIDASYCKVHPDAAGARGSNQGMALTKGGLNTKIHLTVDSHSMPVRILATEGIRADCAEVAKLVEGLQPECLIVDKGYDSDTFVEQAQSQGMQVQIPPSKHLYRHRHLVESALLHLKHWGGIAKRYAKTVVSVVATAQIRCLLLWANIS